MKRNRPGFPAPEPWSSGWACPAMQGMQVRSLVRELRSHMPWGNQARALQSPSTAAGKPAHHNYWSPRATTSESMRHGEQSCMTQLRPDVDKSINNKKRELAIEYQVLPPSIKLPSGLRFKLFPLAEFVCWFIPHPGLPLCPLSVSVSHSVMSDSS